MIRTFAYLTIVLSFSMALTARAELPQAKPADVGMSAEKLSRVVPAMEKFVDEKKVAGAVTIVTKNGKIVLYEAVGHQDIDAAQPMKTDTIFRIYSMTKPITSVAMMMLVEEGKLELDDPVSKYLPEFKGLKVFAGVQDGEIQLEDPKREPTVRDLLRHTSGLTYGFFGDTEVDQRYRAAGVLSPDEKISEKVSKLGKLPLLYQPGTRFNYGMSTDVLGRLVEVASGKAFDEFLQERIFQPLQMHDTGFYVPPEKMERFATNYGPTPEGTLRVVDLPKDSSFGRKPTFLSGGGGLVSTAGDYIRFCQMLLNKGELEGKRLLRDETVQAMTTNQLPEPAYPLELNGKRDGVGFGLGFSVVVEKTAYTSMNRVGEYGWGGAASTHFWISPQDNLAVVALTQLMPFTFQMETALKPIVYEATTTPSQEPSAK